MRPNKVLCSHYQPEIKRSAFVIAELPRTQCHLRTAQSAAQMDPKTDRGSAGLLANWCNLIYPQHRLGILVSERRDR
jgi:hypothetical protein